jgi:hypothetical protein
MIVSRKAMSDSIFAKAERRMAERKCSCLSESARQGAEDGLYEKLACPKGRPALTILLMQYSRGLWLTNQIGLMAEVISPYIHF